MRSFLKQHWVHVTLELLAGCVDFLLCVLSNDDWALSGPTYSQMDRLSACGHIWRFFLPSVTYIFGLYAPNSVHRGVFKRALVIAICVAVTMGLMFGLFYIEKSTEVARSVMIFAFPLAYFAVLFHHSVLLRVISNYRERVAFIVTNTFDELEARLSKISASNTWNWWGSCVMKSLNRAGTCASSAACEKDVSTIVKRNNVHRVLCSNKSIMDPAMCKAFCELRYSGITVKPFDQLV